MKAYLWVKVVGTDWLELKRVGTAIVECRLDTNDLVAAMMVCSAAALDDAQCHGLAVGVGFKIELYVTLDVPKSHLPMVQENMAGKPIKNVRFTWEESIQLPTKGKGHGK